MHQWGPAGHPCSSSSSSNSSDTTLQYSIYCALKVCKCVKCILKVFVFIGNIRTCV